MQHRWYLIQVDMIATLEINPNYLSNDKYWSVLLACHPDNYTKAMNSADCGPNCNFAIVTPKIKISFMET